MFMSFHKFVELVNMPRVNRIRLETNKALTGKDAMRVKDNVLRYTINANFDVTLPSVQDAAGFMYDLNVTATGGTRTATFKDVAGNTVTTVAANAGETKYAVLVSNGLEFRILARESE